MKKIYFIFISAFLLFSCIFLVSAQLGIPHQFYGDVSYNNAPAPNSLSVVAKIDNVVVKQTTTLDGKYGYSPVFLITDPDDNREGKTIVFYVNDIQAAQYIFENGGTTELDLAVTGATTPPTNEGGNTRGGSPGGGGPPSSTTTSAITTPQANEENQSETTTSTLPNEPSTQAKPGITGAVIGALGSTGVLIVLIFIVAIIILLILTFIPKKKKAV